MSENLFFSLLLTVLPPKNNHFQCLYATLVPSTVREDCLRTANQRRIFFNFENQSWEQNEYEDREVLDYLILLLLLMTMVTVLGWIHWIFFYFEWHFIRFRCFFSFSFSFFIFHTMTDPGVSMGGLSVCISLIWMLITVDILYKRRKKGPNECRFLDYEWLKSDDSLQRYVRPFFSSLPHFHTMISSVK